MSIKVKVIGGGIVGLSIGLSILKKLPQVDVEIVEKESSPGIHASSRNSGVIHSGIYYRTDSQKAKFCVEGNPLLKAKLRSFGIPLLSTGKILVAKDNNDVNVLRNLLSRAEANGVNAEIHSASNIASFQKGAKTFDEFLFVRDTAISDPKQLMQKLANEYVSLGGSIELSSRGTLKLANNRVLLNGMDSDLVINAAGAGAIQLASQIGLAHNLRLIPFLGLYFGSRALHRQVKIPIYPVPNQLNPFLGVHLTPTVNGVTKIGPTAIPVLGREQYSITSGVSLRDMIHSTRALTSMALKQPKLAWNLATQELPRFLKSSVLREASQLHDEVAKVRDWENFPAGIRAQLINVDTGKLVDDFIVEEHENSIHILNAVSPGWTSALSFADWLVDTHVREKIQ
jgi:L-2-hydroxyglutarate oxidase LhgO